MFEPEAAIVRQIFHDYVNGGHSLREIIRRLAADQLGPACPTGLVAPDADLTAAITAEWLAEFERVQLLLRLSPRLRASHGD